MSNGHEDKLRSLLKGYGSRCDGDVATLIDRLAHVLAGKDFCIKAHEAIARQNLPKEAFTVEASIEYLIKSLPVGFEQALRSRLDYELAKVIASTLSLFKSGDIMPRLSQLEIANKELSDQIDNLLMPTIEGLRIECDALRGQELALGACNDRRGRMLEFIQKLLQTDPGIIHGWEEAFICSEQNRSAENPCIPGGEWEPEDLSDYSRLSDHFDKVVFLREVDSPTVGCMLQAIRRHNPVAFVFLGRAPKGLEDIYSAGYKIFYMSPGAIIPEGALLGRPPTGQAGRLWAFETTSRSI